MKLAKRLVVFLALYTGAVSALFAEAAIEGKVSLPKRETRVPDTSRYQDKIVGTVAPPNPPVAVVYLEGKFPGRAPTNISAKVIQEHFQFLPATLPIQVGTTVEFPNLDDTYHNVFSYSKPKRFDLGRYRKDEKPATVTFDQPGVIKLYCEIHEHMRATILVLDTPYFTSTATNGAFRLGHLPTGKFTIKAWIDEKTVLKREVEVTEGDTVHLDFTR